MHEDADMNIPVGRSQGEGASANPREPVTLLPQGRDEEVKVGGAQRLLGRVIFYGVLALIVLTAIPYGTVEPWSIALFDAAIFLLTALWAVEGALRGGWFVREHRLLLPLCALVAYSFLQNLPLPVGDALAASVGVNDTWRAISADPYETRLVTLRLLALTLAGALLMRYLSNERRFRALVWCIVGVGVASALFGILRQTTHRGEQGFLLAYLVPGSGYGQFINKNHFAFLMEMALGLVLGLLVGGVARERALAYLAAALPLWTALILCGSRGGVLALLCQSLFLALLFSINLAAQARSSEAIASSHSWLGVALRSAALRLALVLFIGVGVVVGMMWVGGDPLAERMEAARTEILSGTSDGRIRTGRADIWRATLELIKSNPLTGVGFGGYWVAISRYHDASGLQTPQQAHNDYLELVASGGIIGLLLFGWFVVAFLKRVREVLKTFRRGFRRAVLTGALAGLFGVAVHSLVEFGLHVTVNSLICVALIVLATAPNMLSAPEQTPQGDDSRHRI